MPAQLQGKAITLAIVGYIYLLPSIDFLCFGLWFCVLTESIVTLRRRVMITCLLLCVLKGNTVR